MKTRLATACACTLFGVAGVVAQTQTQQQKGGSDSGVHINLDEPPANSKKSPPASPNGSAKPAAPSTSKIDPNKPAVPDAKKKADEIGKIEGLTIPHGDGFMGLQIVDGMFKLSFYDAKKKPIAPDVKRAAFRWSVPYQRQPERDILSPSGKMLTSEKVVRPPYQFKLFITLFKTDSDNYEATDGSIENLTVDFSQGEG
jgi:hypothetical protein